MQARDRRHVTACPVELRLAGGTATASTEDLSEHGLFVRTALPGRQGEELEAIVCLPSGAAVPLRLRVAYVLGEAGAAALGRSPGWGCAILAEPDEAYGDHLLSLERRTRGVVDETPAHVTLIEPGTLLADRVKAGLSRHGFTVEAHPDARSGYAACLRAVPDALVVSTALTGLDAWTLLQMLAGHPRVAAIPVVLVADEGGDMVRLRAFRLGVMDFIEMPFTDEELALRLRRLLPRPGATEGRAGLRGSVADVGVAMVLSLMEFERKSGVLSLHGNGRTARLHVAAGHLLRAEGEAGQGPGEVVAEVLAWTSGSFELVAGEVEGEDHFGQPIAQILLEHARFADESDASADSGDAGGLQEAREDTAT